MHQASGSGELPSRQPAVLTSLGGQPQARQIMDPDADGLGDLRPGLLRLGVVGASDLGVKER